MSSNKTQQVYKLTIYLVGSKGVGKTTYLDRFATGKFRTEYDPTIGVEMRRVRFTTSIGKVEITFLDWCGDSRDGHVDYKGADGVIVMFDVTKAQTYADVGHWMQLIRSANPTTPVIVCGNKVDCAKREVQARDIRPPTGSTKYFDISAKSNYNYEKPILELMRAHFNNPDLRLKSYRV